jgi:hypothetical protein
MSKEAMKLALEALEKIAQLTGPRWALEAGYVGHLEAITALREALAEQPAQQEPFGYFKAEPFGWTDCSETDEGAIALYTTPQAQRKPLTEPEFEALHCKAKGYVQTGLMDVVRLVEAAHGIKEKNT